MPKDQILILKNDHPLLQQIGSLLKRRSYLVEEAASTADVLFLLEKSTFSVLILKWDASSGAMAAFLRQVRKADEQMVCVVMATPAELMDVETRLKPEDFYNCLMNPFVSADQGMAMVERALLQHRLLAEREELSARIQQQSAVLHVLLSHGSDGVLFANGRGELLAVNPAASALLHSNNLQGADALQGLPEALTRIITDWQMIGDGLPALIEVPWADGSVQMVNITPMPEGAENPPGWLMLIRDVSPLKSLDEMRTQALVETSARLCPPLTQGMNDLVDLNVLTSQNLRVNEVVYRLSQTWKRILEWGGDLNALTQIEAGGKMSLQAIDLKTVLQELYDCHNTCNEIRLELSLDPALPPIHADIEQLSGLLHRLVKRAVARSPMGATVRLNAKAHDDQIWISVSDEGGALTSLELAHLFDRTFARNSGGSGCNACTGLEMALVKKITDQMGGRVWVGGPGQPGTTILISLPTAAT